MREGEVHGEEGSRNVGVDSVERPSTERAASIVQTAVEGGRVVSLAGECEVDAPEADPATAGTRHVLLKPDGSVVVHGCEGTSPQMVLSSGGELGVDVVDGALAIEVGRGGAGGVLRVERVDLVASVAVDATEVGDATGPPRDTGAGHETLRERLLGDPDLVEAGFRPLSTERETPAGAVDLYGRDAEGRAVVVEIKSGRAGPAAVGQLDRYVSALRRDLHADAEVRGVLVAPSATERTRRLLEERGFAFRALSPDGS